MPGNQPTNPAQPASQLNRPTQKQRRQEGKTKRLAHLNDRKQRMNELFDARIAQVEAEQID